MTEDRHRLSEYVYAARLRRLGTLEQACRVSGLNRATWLRVESGQPVRDDSLRAVERTLGWDAGGAWAVMAGGEPTTATSPDATCDLRSRIERSPAPAAQRMALLTMLDSLTGLLDTYDGVRP